VETLTALIIGVSTLAAFFCLPSLWRSQHTILKRVIWTLILFVPVLGPVLYGGIFEPPPIKPEGDQSNYNAGADGGGP
jgi:Phospholipase_D-nuclease N-terminal